MTVRSLATALLLAALSGAEARACEGKEVQFDDQFQDATAGWAQHERAKIDSGAYIVTARENRSTTSLNWGFFFEDADFCIRTVVLPNSGLAAGIIFWAKNYNNYYVLQLEANRSYGFYRRHNGEWYTLVRGMPAVAKPPESEQDVLRIVAKRNRVTFYANGQQLREMRGQPPKGGWQIGVFVQAGQTEGSAIFKDVKVTSVD